MYFPFFQREHKVHHHILSAGFFALLFIHAYLGVDAMLAGPTVMEKTGKVAALERQTLSHKELAREARKLILARKKEGKRLTLLQAMNIIKLSQKNTKVGSEIAKNLRVGEKTNTEETMSFSSAPVSGGGGGNTEIYAAKIGGSGNNGNGKGKNTSSTPSTGSSSSGSTSSGTTSSGTNIVSSGSTSPTSSGSTSSGSTLISSGSTTTSSGTTSNTGSTSSGTITVSSGSTSPTSSGSTSSGATLISSGTTSTSSGTTNTGTTSSGIVNPPPPTTTMLPISNTANPHLKKLSDYQNVVGGFVGNHLMVFINMPESQASIEGASYYIANTANEFAKFGVTPIFVIEPFGDNGQLDLGKIKNGDYTAKLDALFSLLRGARGLSEDKLGILVPYPEINTPAFNRNNFVPTDLPILVNQYFDVVRKYYPNARGGLLLDGKSYDIGKTWGQGEYKSYAPYISGIKPGYISTFGIQGFPWVSADGNIKAYDPNVFLPINLAKEGANILSLKKIWFNTGTMKRSYPSNPVYTSPEERQLMMNGIANQGKNLLSQGYSVLIHIFAENKFQMGEGIDWSYIENVNDGVLTPHEAVFANFINGLNGSSIEIGLYDM